MRKRVSVGYFAAIVTALLFMAAISIARAHYWMIHGNPPRMLLNGAVGSICALVALEGFVHIFLRIARVPIFQSRTALTARLLVGIALFLFGTVGFVTTLPYTTWPSTFGESGGLTRLVSDRRGLSILLYLLTAGIGIHVVRSVGRLDLE